MKRIISFAGQWKGEFIYGAGYGDFEGERASFLLFLDDGVNEFSGKAFDIDGVGVQNEAATIKGFYKDGMISFIKQYPKAHLLEDDGSLTLDEKKTSPEIHYYGEYNEQAEEFAGNWEMVVSEIKEGKNFVEFLCVGTWHMKKEPDVL